MRGIGETRSRIENINAVARELRLRDIDFRLDYLIDAESKIRHGNPFLDVIIHAINTLILKAGKMQHGLAHRLAGDGACIDARPADDLALFNHRYPAAALSPLNGRALSRGAGADYDEVVLMHPVFSPNLFTAEALRAQSPNRSHFSASSAPPRCMCYLLELKRLSISSQFTTLHQAEI